MGVWGKGEGTSSDGHGATLLSPLQHDSEPDPPRLRSELRQAHRSPRFYPVGSWGPPALWVPKVLEMITPPLGGIGVSVKKRVVINNPELEHTGGSGFHLEIQRLAGLRQPGTHTWLTRSQNSLTSANPPHRSLNCARTLPVSGVPTPHPTPPIPCSRQPGFLREPFDTLCTLRITPVGCPYDLEVTHGTHRRNNHSPRTRNRACLHGILRDLDDPCTLWGGIMSSTIKQWQHADEYTRRLEADYQNQRDRRSDATPAFRTSDGFTFHYVPGIGWTDGDMTFPTFASLIHGWG